MLVCSGSFVLGLTAQRDSSSLSRLINRHQVRVSLNFQAWSTYSLGMQYYDADSARYLRADDRWNTYLRRGRFGISGQANPNLSVGVQVAFDGIGRDLLSAVDGGSNNGPAPQLRLLNAQLQWRLLPQREAFYLIAGYFPLRIGRESLTASSRSTTMEKALSQNYLRTQLVGVASGRAGGLGLGGYLVSDRIDGIAITYDLSVQNPVYPLPGGGHSSGRHYTPFFSGRVVVQLGDPEMKQYVNSLTVNYFGQRRGLSIGLAAAHQGTTDWFSSNRALGVDWLLNYGPFNLDGDYSWLRRRGNDGAGEEAQMATGYVRASYNINLPRDLVLEPVVGYWLMRGAKTVAAQAVARRLDIVTGSDSGLNLGVNLYLSPELKLSFHYTQRRGNAGRADPLTIDNLYFQQPGLGPVRRGNWLGLGVNIVMQ